MISKVIHGHIRPLICQNLSSLFVYGQIVIKICMNANIMETQFFHEIIYDLKYNFYIMEKFYDSFTLRPCDLITTLSSVFMDNFCPGF